MAGESSTLSVSAWNGSATLKSLLHTRARAIPEAPAFKFWSAGQVSDQLTFGGLHAAACAAAEKFIDAGCKGGSIALVHQPGLDFLVDFFGCIYAGCSAVPLPAPLQQRERDRFGAVTGLVRPSLVVAPANGVSNETLQQWRRDWPELAFLHSQRSPATSAELPEVHGDDTAVIQFTSGSSSSPRGVILSHSAVMTNLAQIHDAFDFRSAERHESVVLWLPHFHDMGLFGRLECVYAGCPCHVMSPVEFTKRPMRWLELVAKTRATVTGAPNFAFELCAELGESRDADGLDLSGLRVAFCGAEPINAATLDRFEAVFCSFGLSPAALLPCYGLAEATLMVSSHIPGRVRNVVAADAHALEQGKVERIRSQAAKRLVSCGRVVSGMQVAIVDPRTRSPLPPHTVGEIWIRGANVSNGYFGDDEGAQTAFAAVAGGSAQAPRYLRTGDLGCWVDDELLVVGRTKNIIIVHGRNLHPHDLERLVPECHPILKTSRAAAVAVDTPRGERPALLVEVPREAERRPAELAQAADSVAGEIRRQFEIDPARVMIVRRGAIAWTTSGKIAHRETAARLRRGGMRVLAEWPTEMAATNSPETVEDVILGIVGHVLGRAVHEPDLGFRALGGDSLAAHRVAARLRDIYGPAFDEHDLFMELPIREISRLVDLRLAELVNALSEDEVEAALSAIGDPSSTARAGELAIVGGIGRELLTPNARATGKADSSCGS